MHIMFVCTGNVCRSPMGELLLSRYLKASTITVSSAGTRGMICREIDPLAGRLMTAVGLDPSGFRSRRLTRHLCESADLILCFEEAQRTTIVTLAPTVVPRTFMLTDFANMSEYCARRSMVQGSTLQERLTSVISAAPMIRPLMPLPADIADPHGKELPQFREAADQTNRAIRRILISMRKQKTPAAAAQTAAQPTGGAVPNGGQAGAPGVTPASAARTVRQPSAPSPRSMPGASRTRTVRSAPVDPATPTFSSAPQFSSAPGNSAGSRGTGNAAPRTTPAAER